MPLDYLMTRNAGTMKEWYALAHVMPTSEVGDIALIRSHIHYHAGENRARQADIRPTRGHKYKVSLYGRPSRKDDYHVVSITDYLDHRHGIVGIFSITV